MEGRGLPADLIEKLSLFNSKIEGLESNVKVLDVTLKNCVLKSELNKALGEKVNLSQFQNGMPDFAL